MLVSGANGFVGAALTRALAGAGFRVRAAVRAGTPAGSPSGAGAVETVAVGDIAARPDWGPALRGAFAVVHVAGLPHAAGDAPVPASRHDAVNHLATARLARAALAAGVERFVFPSTATVYGPGDGTPAVETDPVAPVHPYAVSKLAAERALHRIARDGPMRAVCLRVPLVHGPGATGNLAALARLARSGLPLPLGAFGARRSLVCLDNLADLVATLLVTDVDAGGTWNVADGHDPTLAEILGALATGQGARPPRLVPVPVPALAALARALGRTEALERLTRPVRVDAGALRRRLGWRPPRDALEALAGTGASFRDQGAR